MLPEITVTDLSEKLKSQDQFILLDVREPNELEYAELSDSRLEVTPMSRLAREGLGEEVPQLQNIGEAAQERHEAAMLFGRALEVDDVVVEVLPAGRRGDGEQLRAGRVDDDTLQTTDLGFDRNSHGEQAR